MSPTPHPLVEASNAAIHSAASLIRDVASIRTLDDDVLLNLLRGANTRQQQATTDVAVFAGELARRSAPELGHAGLAQRTGHRTPEALVRATTGSTSRDANSAVRAGRLVHDAAGLPDPETGEVPFPAQPWLGPVGIALVAGSITVADAESIRSGLGDPTADISASLLRDAAARLVQRAGEIDSDRLYREARSLRDEIDEAGVADREAAQRDRRGLRFRTLPDGTAQIIWTLDQESAATCRELFDRATSPRRGGPRFVSDDGKAAARRILDDTRTTEQLLSDVFVELLRQGAAAASSELLGTGAPVVRVLVTATALDLRSGRGHIEGSPDAISIATVERLVCSGGVTEVTFDQHGNPLDVEREQRLFTKRQREALACRDGGCMFGDCDRPPSWTEAHHINHWARDHGSTNIDDGILLCRHHHLLLHNNGWEIVREGSQRWLIPPPDIDPGQVRIPLRSKSAAYRELIGTLAS